jgi:Peptidase family M50
MNVVLFLFNLLPAFPMDGGRVLRSILAIPLDRLTATRVAVFVSVGLAVLFGVAGVLFWHNPWLIFIGLFLIWAGHQELRMLALREEERLHDEEPAASWNGLPRTTVIVYIWDPRTREWIPQGVIPAHRFTEAGRRVV